MKNRRSAFYAVLAGFFADILTTQILVIVLALLLGAKTFGGPGSVAPDKLAPLLQQLQNSLPFLLPATALGLLASTIGGYVAAAFSEKGEELRNAFFTGALSLLIDATAFFDPGAAPRWLLVLGFALQLPATLGGALLQRGAARDAAAAKNRDET